MTILSGRRVSNSRPIAWKAIALPIELLPLIILNKFRLCCLQITSKQSTWSILKNFTQPNSISLISKSTFQWAEQGSNLRTRERTDLQSVAFNRSAICPKLIPIYPQSSLGKLGAEEGSRTPDLLITNQLLYQLSYFGYLFYGFLSLIKSLTKRL